MKVQIGGEPPNQNSSTSDNKWSEQDRKALTDLFALLLEMEIDQNNVTKECADEDTHK